MYYGKEQGGDSMKKKGLLIVIMFIVFFCNTAHAEFYSSLPADIGSNSQIMEILYPEEKKVTSHSESYLISFMAEPGTEITLYERYEDTLFVPLTVNNEAITGVVGDSGLYLIDMTFKPNSVNRIMFFAQKGKKYQSEFRTIVIEEEEEKTEQVKYKILNIQEFVRDIKNSNNK